MGKQLNILFLASWYPNELLPKNGNFIQQHARAVSGFCNVAALHIIARNQEAKFEITTTENQDVYEVIIYYKKINSSNPVAQLKKLMRRHQAHLLGYNTIISKFKKIDVCHLNVVFPAGNFAIYLKKKFGIPYILSENWTTLLDSNPNQMSKLVKKMVTRTLNYADYLCPVSNDLKNALEKLSNNKKVEIIPNVVNPSVFSYRPHDKGKRILHISNLKDEHKNITGILNTVKKLSNERQDFFITLAGNGDYNYFNNYAKEIGIPEKMYSIEGSKSYDEVADLMKTHDFFLLYSNYENLPCVISEALVCGMPILTSKAGGTDEMVDDSNGFVIPAKNDEILYEKMSYLLDNLHLYDNEKIAKDALKTYSYNAVGEQFLAIYNKLI